MNIIDFPPEILKYIHNFLKEDVPKVDHFFTTCKDFYNIKDYVHISQNYVIKYINDFNFRNFINTHMCTTNKKLYVSFNITKYYPTTCNGYNHSHNACTYTEQMMQQANI